MNHVLQPVLIPIIGGGIILLLRAFPGVLALLFSLITLYAGANVYLAGDKMISYPWLPFGIDFSLRAQPLSALSMLFASFFTLLVILFSLKFMQEKPKSYRVRYYSFIIINAGLVNGAVLANNLVIMLFFWEAALIMLYALVNTGETPETHSTANKAFITVGFGDFCLMLGVLIYWHLTGGAGFVRVGVVSPAAYAAFFLMAAGALAKAGAMPFHNWIPAASENTPVTIMAYLPASLDKLLGIYFLARISIDVFVFTPAMGIVLMAVGSFTIVAAVFMALIQHDFRKLLSYHAISQVGYMVLGIGTGNPIGIVGGVFHMLNNTIYKTALFLCGGSVQKKAGTAELDRLGGYARTMPVTFICFLIASLAISGIPPLNGFFSKWMIYQGIIGCWQQGIGGVKSPLVSATWWLFLIAAMFGSALTLASFMKLIHAIFLGQPERPREKKSEVNWTMWLPGALLALLCIVFGLFAVKVPLGDMIIPALGEKVRMAFATESAYYGSWSPMLAAGALILGLIIGLVIYLIGMIHPRETAPYIGGETMTPEMHVSGVDFYQTVRDLPVMRAVYAGAQKGAFDFYEWGMAAARSVSGFLYISVDRLTDKTAALITRTALNTGKFVRLLHGGFLSVYLFWSLLGLTIMLLVLMR
jgi:formate hydrogenlyase subunit 3/multisubunit Na+/H+ antiporter MnhD subunit